MVSLNKDRDAILKCMDLFPSFHFVQKPDSLFNGYHFSESLIANNSHLPYVILFHQQTPFTISYYELFQEKTIIELKRLRNWLPELINKYVKQKKPLDPHH